VKGLAGALSSMSLQWGDVVLADDEHEDAFLAHNIMSFFLPQV
jgi:hypothetical protein